MNKQKSWFTRLMERLTGIREMAKKNPATGGKFGQSHFKLVNGVRVLRKYKRAGVIDAWGRKLSPGALRLREIAGCDLEKAFGKGVG